jgi:aspartyl aminopeptidase
VTEDPPDGAREHDRGHETQAAAAVGALQYVDVETAAHQLGPGAIACPSYATDGESWASFERWAREADVSTQRFVVRSDLGCGSTIGPITAAELGIRTVDAGNPMLSMHSCREVAAAADIPKMIDVMKHFFDA